ncbi:hypothetical protein [Nakamurella sp.]|uniref:hypothetical protein n=1 Tax=Nakamurella sp. TaxID=1869182 RepID=UPI003784964A
MPAPPSERSLAASIAAHESWAHTPDRSARTAPARAALDAKFEALADPDGVLLPHERARRAEHLRRAHFQRLALASARSRRRARELTDEAARAEAAIAELGESDVVA